MEPVSYSERERVRRKLIHDSMATYFHRLREEPGFINLGRSDHRDVRARLFADEPHLVDHYPNGRYVWGGWQFEVRHDGLHFMPLDHPSFKTLFEENPSAVIPNPAQGIHAPAVPRMLRPVRIPQEIYAAGSNFWETYWRKQARPGEYGKPQVLVDQDKREEARRRSQADSPDPDPLQQPHRQPATQGGVRPRWQYVGNDGQ